MSQWSRKINGLMIINAISILVLLCVPFLNFERLKVIVGNQGNIPQHQLLLVVVVGVVVSEIVSLVILINVYDVILSLGMIELKRGVLLFMIVTSKIFISIINNFIPSEFVVTYPILLILRDFMFGVIVLVMMGLYFSENFEYRLSEHKITVFLLLVINIIFPILQVYVWNQSL